MPYTYSIINGKNVLTGVSNMSQKMMQSSSMKYHDNKLSSVQNIPKKYIENQIVFRKFGKPPFYGCELEIAFDDEINEQKCLDELWDMKYGYHLAWDDSIQGYGFEIVTDPMDFEHMVLLFKKIFKVLNKYGAKCDSSCGLHIHIDKTTLLKYKVMEIFKAENQDKLELIGLRQLNDYCHLKDGKYKKYNAANIEGHKHTIELRFFRCTMILKNIMKYLLFTKDIIEMDILSFIKKYKL